MRGSEKFLLLAVRDKIRSACGYRESECNVELDEMAPATVGQLYVAVMPGGCSPTGRHNTSGGVRDITWRVNAMLVKRIREVPRDRLRNVFIENLDCLDEEIDKVIEAVDWDYGVINAASDALDAVNPAGRFLEPLKFTSLDDKPRMADPEIFAGAPARSGNIHAGMVRTIRFSGARRITYTAAAGGAGA